MQEIFKAKLLELRRPAKGSTFAEALFGQVSWIQGTPVKRVATPKEEGVKLKEAFSEKQQVIESLERFVEEKTQNVKIPIIPVSGGEVGLKKTEMHEHSFELKNLSSLKEHISPQAFSQIEKIVEGKSELEILFITESFRAESERENLENPSDLMKSFLPCLPAKTSELFERMVMAMKIEAKNTILIGLENEGEDLLKAVVSVVEYLKPQIVVTLGAKSTQKILKNNDRLTMVHGQYFTRKMGEYTAQIVPLFHPSIIETNQNMKKTAWIDMQKIMKTLKKV